MDHIDNSPSNVAAVNPAVDLSELIANQKFVVSNLSNDMEQIVALPSHQDHVIYFHRVSADRCQRDQIAALDSTAHRASVRTDLHLLSGGQLLKCFVNPTHARYLSRCSQAFPRVATGTRTHRRRSRNHINRPCSALLVTIPAGIESHRILLAATRALPVFVESLP